MTFWTFLCIVALTVASIITSFHLSWTNRRVLRLERRVHELEMDRDYPGWNRDTESR